MKQKHIGTVFALVLLAALALAARVTGKIGISDGALGIWGLWVGEIVLVQCRRALGHPRPTAADLALGAALAVLPVTIGYGASPLLSAIAFAAALVALTAYLRYADTTRPASQTEVSPE